MLQSGIQQSRKQHKQIDKTSEHNTVTATNIIRNEMHQILSPSHSLLHTRLSELHLVRLPRLPFCKLYLLQIRQRESPGEEPDLLADL